MLREKIHLHRFYVMQPNKIMKKMKNEKIYSCLKVALNEQTK